MEADASIEARARFDAKKKLILLEVGNQTAAFAGARVSRTSLGVSAPVEKTGQDLGLQVELTELWTTRQTRPEFRSCLPSARYSECDPASGRPIECDTSRLEPIRNGSQWVEVHEINQIYRVNASIRNRSSIDVATATGKHIEKSEEVYPITQCY